MESTQRHREVAPLLLQADLESPAWVLDVDRMCQLARGLAPLRAAGCRLLYSAKALPAAAVLTALAPHLDGYGASSLYEARLIRETVGPSRAVQLTTPGLRAEEVPELSALCDAISFNSLSLLARHAGQITGACSIGLRINPECSSLDDPRYDPCRPHSKLGVPVSQLEAVIRNDPHALVPVQGLHLHTHFEGCDFQPLRRVVERLGPVLDAWPGVLRWVNLGGGYWVDTPARIAELVALLSAVRRRWGVEPLFEPGKGLVGEAGWLVARVLDVFEVDGRLVAVLDTSVNHLPEVFEYQVRPPVAGANDAGGVEMLLYGSTCLSGDCFGSYRFDAPLRVGDPVLFPGVGAYTLIKAQRFNGLPLPGVYLLRDGKLGLWWRDDYRNYRAQWRPAVAESVGNPIEV